MGTAYQIQTSSLLDVQNLSGQRNVARDPVTGRIWVAIHNTSTHYVQVAYSDDNGATWTIENASPTAGIGTGDQSIAVDSAGDVHIAYALDSRAGAVNSTKEQVCYRKRTAGVWGTEALLTDVAYDQKQPIIALDSSGDIFVVWNGGGFATGGNPAFVNVGLFKNTSGSWGSREAVSDVQFNQSFGVSIAVDSTNKVHIVWCGDVSTNWQILHYKIRATDGSYSADLQKTILASKDHKNPSVSLDSTDVPHVTVIVINSRLTYDEVYYLNLSGGVWSAAEDVHADMDRDVTSCSISVDLSDLIHITYVHAGVGTYTANTSVLYRTRTLAGVWTDPVVLVNNQNFSAGVAVFFWAKFPLYASQPATNYGFVFHLGTASWYYDGEPTWTTGNQKVRISGIRHLYRPGSYRMELTAGDLSANLQLPSLPPYVGEVAVGAGVGGIGKGAAVGAGAVQPYDLWQNLPGYPETTQDTSDWWKVWIPFYGYKTMIEMAQAVGQEQQQATQTGIAGFFSVIGSMFKKWFGG